MKIFQQKSVQYVLYVSVLLSLAYLYDYHKELFMRPNSFHIWRQCDGAQITMNYYNVSMNFLEPRLSVLMGNDGKMVSEFPIIYYLVACLYKLFGPHEFFIRLISVTIFFVGLFSLYKALHLLLKDRTYAFLVSLIPFASAVVSDYAFSFIPDVPALSLTFVGYFYFLRFMQSKSRRSAYLATLFFALAGLLKVTSLIGFLAIGGVLLYYRIFMARTVEVKEYLAFSREFVIMMVVPVLVSAAWVFYAGYYNAANHNTYFLMKAQPIWKAEGEYILTILHRFHWQWLRMYLYRDFLHTLPLLAILCFAFFKRSSAKPVLLWLTLSMAGGVAYFLLFFTQFYHHDYYVICLMFLPPAIVAVLLLRIQEWAPAVYQSLFSKAALLLLLAVMFYHGIRINRERDALYATEKFNEFRYIEPALEKLGVKKTDKVISLGDETTGVSLYLMNRRGWTEVMSPIPLPSKTIQQYVDAGAKYLFIYRDADSHLEEESRQRYLQSMVGIVNGIKIYKL